jgi:UTP--glucose-1-phosphate uridylyltransferase
MISKAVIPAAGSGTRFLPATKSQPKEMLPIVDTPVIQYVVEEAVSCGITDILMVIGQGKRAIEEHFDRSFHLEAQLIEKGKQVELKTIQRISELANIHFVWQKELRGLGDAIFCARHHVNNEPFAVLLGDTVIDADVPATQQLLEVFSRYEEPVVLLEEVDRNKIGRYGIIDGKQIDPAIYLIKDFVEKPEPDEAPSNLAIAGRYVFTPQIFDYVRQTKPGKGNEIQITDAMCLMVRDRAIYGVKLNGKRCDIGNKEGFIRTNIEFALSRDDMTEQMQNYIRKLANELPKSNK